MKKIERNLLGKYMNCKEKFKWNNSVDLVLSKIEKLSKNDLSKLKKHVRDENELKEEE